MKITNIKQQVKNEHRASVYVDKKYAFSLDISEISKRGLYAGQELDEKELSELRDASLVSLALNRCFNLLSYRSRSEWEITDYLKRKDYPGSVINKVTELLRSKGYLDDYQFASQWVSNRLNLSQSSIIKLKSELRGKRVNSEIINRVLSEANIDEQRQIDEIISKKREQSKYQDKLKLMQYLSRRGYSYDKIKEALNKVS